MSNLSVVRDFFRNKEPPSRERRESPGDEDATVASIPGDTLIRLERLFSTIGDRHGDVE